MQTLSQGKTYDHAIQGVFTILLGIILVFWLPIFGLLILGGVGMILLESGIQINSDNNKIRRYHAILNLYFGKWKDLGSIKKIVLTYNGHQSPTYRPLYLSKQPATLRTYDLVFSEPPKKDYVFFEFLAYKIAAKALEELSKITPCEIENQIHTHRLKQQKRRGRR